jgi:hypothetical protein
MIMSLRRASAFSPYLAAIVGVVFLSSLLQAQTGSSISLVFPVKQNSVCGGTCTPQTAPIMTVFDHEMEVAYECTTGEGGYGSVTAFTGETGTVKYSGLRTALENARGCFLPTPIPIFPRFCWDTTIPSWESFTTTGTRPSITAFPLEHPCTPRLTDASRISRPQKAFLMVPEGTCSPLSRHPPSPRAGVRPWSIKPDIP